MVSSLWRGGSRSSRTRDGMRWTRVAPKTRAPARGRRSRVVLTPRRWRQVGGSYSAGDGGKKARSPGRARYKLLKPLRGECRVIPGVPAVTNACAFYTPHAAAGAIRAPGIPRALCYQRDDAPAQLGRFARRECEAVSWRHRVHGCLKFESERMIEPWLARRPKPQNGEVRLRSRFARLRRTRFALSVLRGCATRSPQGRSVVPLAGIEPALLAELDFESSASTNSATGASHDDRLRANATKPAEYSGRRVPVNPRAADRDDKNTAV